jgi:hypothetical protein
VTVIAQGAACLVDGGSHPAIVTLAVVALSGMSAILLIIGFLTPFAGGAVALCSILIGWAWVPIQGAGAIASDKHIAAFIVVVGAAIVLLGPGASSLDAYLFGRREIVIPHESRSRRSES